MREKRFTNYEITVSIAEPSVPAQLAGVAEQAAEAALKMCRHGPCAMTVLITGEEEIRVLNRTYREIDAPTDVLAFEGITPGFVMPTQLPDYLGDVVICYAIALSQAEEQGHSVEAELALLTVHGVLHLLGYDHTSDEEKAVMWSVQRQILESLGLKQLNVSEL